MKPTKMINIINSKHEIFDFSMKCCTNDDDDDEDDEDDDDEKV